MRYAVIPYRAGSRGASGLARALPQGRVLRLAGSRFQPRRDDVIINWGNTNPPYAERALNGRGIQDASNKLRFFQLLTAAGQGEIAPPYWRNSGDIPDDAFPIVCRTVLAGHSGEGIVIANTRAEIVPAPLYVKYIKKESEFRIHVGRRLVRGQHPNGTREPWYDTEYTIIAEQRKVKRADAENVDFRIRNHAGGFVFQREGIVVPECVRTIARTALAQTTLDFGAVDVIYNRRNDRAYVLEINTAPGLEGQTVNDYVRFFTNANN